MFGVVQMESEIGADDADVDGMKYLFNAGGRHTDGGGLYLVVDQSGASRWLLRILVRGNLRLLRGFHLLKNASYHPGFTT